MKTSRPILSMALDKSVTHIRRQNCILCPISNKPYCFKGFAESCHEALVKYFILEAEKEIGGRYEHT